MNTLYRLALLAPALLLADAAQADRGPLDETFTAFARCDASFFSSLHDHAAAWKLHAPLASNGSTTWMAVDNRAGSANSIALKGDPRVGGLRLEGYFDKSSEMGALGYYLFWGFIVDEPLETAVAKLLPLVENPEEVRPTRGQHARSQVRVGSEWRPTYDQGGIAAGTKLLERVLIFESELPGKTTVSCSLQGAVDAAVLKELRPDIPHTQYPQPPATTKIADVALPAGIRDGLDVPLLAPRFKSISYGFVSSGDGKPDTLPPTVIKMTAENGLLNRTEMYSPTFAVERVMKAGLFQLKSRMSSGDGRVLLTRSLKLDIPDRWTPGATISGATVMDRVPARPGDEPSKFTLSCRIGERYPASRIQATLQGDAIALDCSDKNSRNISAFIEDLGISINLESSYQGELRTYTYSDFEVVR